MVEALRFGADDQAVLERIPAEQRVVAVVNKIDLLKQPGGADPVPRPPGEDAGLRGHRAGERARPARTCPSCWRRCARLLPEGPAAYPPDQLTDRDERFFAAELLREKLFEQLGEELPYRCEVVIDSFKEEGRLRRIEATILVERDSQKPIVLGAGGERLKRMATAARKDMEKLVRRQGVPGHLGQGAQGLDRRRARAAAAGVSSEAPGRPRAGLRAAHVSRTRRPA